MFFKTPAECDELARFIGFERVLNRGEVRRVGTPALQEVSVSLAGNTKALYFLAEKVTSWFGPMWHSLLWITEHGIWPGCENLHLYYKLRQSYGDYRELRHAPGHVFLSYEQADLITFLHLALDARWGGFLLGTPNLKHITFSHDEWILISAADEIATVQKDIDALGLPSKRLDQA